MVLALAAALLGTIWACRRQADGRLSLAGAGVDALAALRVALGQKAGGLRWHREAMRQAERSVFRRGAHRYAMPTLFIF